jgi:hypothetical protein
MDVLRFIKDDHERIRSLFTKFESTQDPTEAQKSVNTLLAESRAYQSVEQGHILPEFSAFLRDRDRTVLDHCQQRSDALKAEQDNLFKELGKVLGKTRSFEALRKRVLELKTKTFEHFEQIEQDLMPRVRQAVPTQDREDMGIVFHDLREEALSTTSQYVH